MAVTDSLTKATVALTGASVPLVPADPGRRTVIVGNPATNGVVTVDPTGGNAATGGLPLQGGNALVFSDWDCKMAMTIMGANGQSVTVYTGR